MASTEAPAAVVIAGGGIVGLTLAMALKSQLGIIPEIYEKTNTFATEAGAGLGMYPNGLRVLRDISPKLLAAVREAGYPYKSRHWERHDGTEIMNAEERVLSEGESELESIGIRRSRLQKILYSYALSQGISIQFNKPLHSAEERENNLLQVNFGDGTSRLTKVLFGADGALGKSRSIVAGPANPDTVYTGVTCLMGLAKCHREGIAFPSSDKDDFHAVFFPTAKNEQCFQFHLPVPEKDSNKVNWGNLSNEVGKEECRKIAHQLRLEGWHEKYIEPLNNVVRAVRVGFAVLEPSLKSWTKGRIALVGDAAHPPVPYVGQGAQQGLEDAGVAVSLLKIYCLDNDGNFDPTNFEEAMKVYQKIRIPRSSQILDFSKSLGKIQANRAGRGYLAKAADYLLKGDVLMYGTIPAMLPGAQHDYKEDVLRATKDHTLPIVTIDKTLEALDQLLGNNEPNRSCQVQKLEITSNYVLSHNRFTQLTEWLIDILHHLLKQIIAHRSALKKMERTPNQKVAVQSTGGRSQSTVCETVLDEVCEVIKLPQIQQGDRLPKEEQESVVLPNKVLSQLREYVTSVASFYRSNPFHNLEHACHVTMAVFKLLTQMAAESDAASPKPDKTHGITDPLAQFACVLSALIHDVDHEGVPNTQLVKEHPIRAHVYHGKCLAECHSIDLAWEMLMDPKYEDLQATIYTDNDELQRFRQIIVNIVIATDICDKDMKAFRNARWEKAFSKTVQDMNENRDRKTTIGMEHLIQASDVSHTMQPWNVYIRWNQQLFEEMYAAYKEGRAAKNPSEFWYTGEIGFFDFYVIPLAKRLEKCELFGSSYCSECLKNAMKNREDWVQKGEDIVKEMANKAKKQWSAKNTHLMVEKTLSPSIKCALTA